MKSMSISAQGSATFACVCRCSSGLLSAWSPAIHIFAGENVCIHAIRPMHESSALASRHSRLMAAVSVSTGFQTTRAVMSGAASSASAITRDWLAT
jgi:hypothetical protein